MPTISPTDLHYLRAAEGWLELGNPGEALLELEQISAPGNVSLEVVGARWAVFAELKRWTECVTVAETMLQLAPDNPAGWIHRSFALHELQRTREARDLLLPAAPQFLKVETIRYNLACYECQLGNLDAAWEWFEQALALHEPAEIRERAAQDPDLKPLWPRIARQKD